MYTWTMSWQERKHEFLRDQQILEPLRQYTASRLRKIVRKVRHFPFCHIQHVTAPTNNRYLWIFMFLNPEDSRNFRYELLSFALIQSEKGIFVFTSFEGALHGSGAVMLIPHFFSRYAERTGQSFTSPLCCIETFLTRNIYIMVRKRTNSFSEEMEISSYEVCAPSQEGVCLGLCDPYECNNILLKTFVTYDMLRTNQMPDVAECLSSMNQASTNKRSNSMSEKQAFISFLAFEN